MNIYSLAHFSCHFDARTNYVLRDGSAAHQDILNYEKKCAEFVAYAERITAKYKAAGAVMYLDKDMMKVVALNFSDETVPLNGNWHMDPFGSFWPNPQTEEIYDFGFKNSCYATGTCAVPFLNRAPSPLQKSGDAFGMELPYFHDVYPKVPEELRYAVMDDGKIVLSFLFKDADLIEKGEIDSSLPGCDYLDRASSRALFKNSTEDEKNRLRHLWRAPYHNCAGSEWIPASVALAKVFDESEEIQYLNAERMQRFGDWKMALKHSPLGIAFRRYHPGKLLQTYVR